MPDFSLPRYKSIFRVLTLFLMLSGLLFSSGEGIRLFPFPLPATTAAAAASPHKNLQSENIGRADYEKNLPRFEKEQGKQPSFKRQQQPSPSSPHHSPWGNAGSIRNLSLVASPAAAIKFSVSFQSAKSRLFARARASRAPPFLRHFL